MKGSFQKALQREISRQSRWSAIYITGILLLLLLLFSFLLQYSHLVKATRQLVKETEVKLQENKQVLVSLNQEIAGDFLTGDRTDREVFSYFYEKRGRSGFETDLFILDQAGQIVLATDSALEQKFVSDYHLRILLEHASVDFIDPKVLVMADHQHYLIFVQPVLEATEQLGYSVLLVSDRDFMSQSALSSVQYLLTDQFGHVFTKNSTYFVSQPLEKLDTRQWAAHGLFNWQAPLVKYQLPIGRHLTLYTFQTFVPIGFLGLFALFTTATLIGVYFFQMRALGRKIIAYNLAPIEALVSQMQQIPTNEIQKVNLKTGDEFELIANQINQMLAELQQLHTQKLTLEREKLFFERKMLEAQFNPHFLYNTLETIKITHELDGDLTKQLIQNLTMILRYSVSHRDEETYLGKDLTVIASYLAIHAIRFDGLRYQILCPDALHQAQVPRLFLLPLVENAIKYGRQYRIDLEIVVEVAQVADKLVFRVTDNAGGLTPAERTQILASLDSHQTQHGIVNSYRRLREYFEEVQLDLGVNRQGETWVEFRVKGARDVQISHR